MEPDSSHYVALDRETRLTLSTAEAAYHLGHSEQTLRCWSYSDAGPLRPLRVHGRLAWPVAEIRRLLCAGSTEQTESKNTKTDVGDHQ